VQIVLVYQKPFHRISLSKCALQPKIVKNSLKNPILGVQGRWRSWMLINLKSSSPVFVTISSMSIHICSRFHTIRAFSGKITFLGGTPLLCPLSKGTPSSRGMKFCHDRILGAANSEDFVTLVCTIFIGLKGVTDRWTDSLTMAKMHEALCAVVCKNKKMIDPVFIKESGPAP